MNRRPARAAGSPAAGASIEHAIRRTGAEGRPAIIPFFTAGYPTRAGFADTLNRLSGGADVIEIGVPFSDPMADGLTIQRASRAALEAGVSLEWILDELEARAPCAADPPIVLMSYFNPLYVCLDELVARAVRCGVRGIIVPDLPQEEAPSLPEVLDEAGIAFVQLVSPVTSRDRLELICGRSRGFVYAVTSTGTTGQANGLTGAVPEYLARVRAAAHLPVCAGFGIRTREQVERLAPHVDGVIVGSALVEALERGEDPGQYLASLRPDRGYVRAG